MKRIGIIGASGFIGKNLVRHLRLNDHFTILPTSRTAKNGFIALDLNHSESIIEFVNSLDTLFYLAHEGGPNQTTPIDQVFKENLHPLQNLIDAAQRGKRLKPLQVIYLSSGGAVYGISKTLQPWKETDSLHPVSNYGIAKVEAEKLLRQASESGIINCVCIRASNPYGNFYYHDKPQGIIDVIISKLAHDEPLILFDPITNVRDYIHLNDLNQALLLAMNETNPFEIYNIGSGTGTSLSQVILMIENLIQKKIKIIEQSHKNNTTTVPWSILNINKAITKLNWNPKISLSDGLAELIQRKMNHA